MNTTRLGPRCNFEAARALDTERRDVVPCASSRPLTGVRPYSPRGLAQPHAGVLFSPAESRRRERAVLFVDGSNWYHSLREQGIREPGELHYGRISRKLVRDRDWLETRYYVGQVQQRGRARLYSEQRRFLTRLHGTDPRISVHLGRLEPRTAKSPAARELIAFLAGLSVRIDPGVHHRLVEIAREHRSTTDWVEKAVDVMIAVDMVVLAERDRFDVAYLLSADGDFTPAVEAVRARRKKVFAVSAAHGAQLAAACDAFIRLDAEWLADCYR